MLFIRKYSGIKPARMHVNGQTILENKEGLEFGKFLKSIYRHLEAAYPKYFKMDGLSKLGYLSVECLLQNTGLQDRFPADKVGFVLTNASSSIQVDQKHWATIRDRSSYFPSPSNFVYTLPNIMGGEAAIRHVFRGENTVLITRSFDPDVIHDITCSLIETGAVDCCICGWVEHNEDNYESLLFLVEGASSGNQKQNSGEDVIFEAPILSELYKQHTEWKT